MCGKAQGSLEDYDNPRWAAVRTSGLLCDRYGQDVALLLLTFGNKLARFPASISTCRDTPNSKVVLADRIH